MAEKLTKVDYVTTKSAVVRRKIMRTYVASVDGIKVEFKKEVVYPDLSRKVGEYSILENESGKRLSKAYAEISLFIFSKAEEYGGAEPPLHIYLAYLKCYKKVMINDFNFETYILNRLNEHSKEIDKEVKLRGSAILSCDMSISYTPEMKDIQLSIKNIQ